ncbi:MAG: fatty acid desaturase [Sulfitobacter sp.]
MHADIFPPPPPPSAIARRVKAVRAWDWPTVVVLVACLGVFALALSVQAGVVQWVLLVMALTLHSSLSHEILHGHPFNSDRAGTVLGLVQPGLFIPYLRFKALHLAHHHDATLTDPYDDPETNYLDPEVWHRLPRWQQQMLMFNNTLLGRMAIGPLIGWVVFVRDDLRKVMAGDRQVALHWLAHVPGVALTLWLVSLSSISWLGYLSACYGALSVLRIRTFLEHRAHERASGRSVIIEDRGVLSFLFLNNNFHAVHHMHPKVAWYKLPALYRSRKARFLKVNQGYVYRSYGSIFARHFLRAKDPVPHPLWQAPDD